MSSPQRSSNPWPAPNASVRQAEASSGYLLSLRRRSSTPNSKNVFKAPKCNQVRAGRRVPPSVRFQRHQQLGQRSPRGIRVQGVRSRERRPHRAMENPAAYRCAVLPAKGRMRIRPLLLRRTSAVKVQRFAPAFTHRRERLGAMQERRGMGVDVPDLLELRRLGALPERSGRRSPMGVARGVRGLVWGRVSPHRLSVRRSTRS